MAPISRLKSVIRKYRRFWSRETVDEPIVAIRSWILPCETINNCYDDEFVLRTYEKNYALRESVQDDYIPMLCPEFGPAFLAHVAGCEIFYQSGASWNKPLLKDLSDTELEKIQFHEERFELIVNRINYFKAHNNSGYIISSGDLESPFELAVELLGVEKFCLGFYDSPRQMHKFLNLCFDCWYKYVREIHQHVSIHEGGYFSLWNTWQPENTVWTSIDAAMIASPAIFETFFQPIIEKILSKFDWIWVHLHSAATVYILDFLSDDPRIKGFEIADDPNCRTKTIFPSLKKVHDRKTLLLDCKKEDAELFAGEFDPEGLLLFVDGIETPEEANLIIDKVKRNRYE